MITQPIKHSYWVVPGKLLAGEYPRNVDEESSQAKIDALLSAGMANFIDLTEATEGLLPYAHMIGAASHQRFAIRDVSIPDSPEQTKEILDAIDRHLDEGRKVYVHCWGGVGRTGIIVGCWLARHGSGGNEALKKLRELWQSCPKSSLRMSPETRQQEQYILNWRES